MYEIKVPMQSSNPLHFKSINHDCNIYNYHNVLLFNYIYMPVFHINMWKEEITNKTTCKHYSIKTNNTLGLYTCLNQHKQALKTEENICKKIRRKKNFSNTTLFMRIYKAIMKILYIIMYLILL